MRPGKLSFSGLLDCAKGNRLSEGLGRVRPGSGSNVLIVDDVVTSVNGLGGV